jgi:hypothetical protein
VRSWLTNTAERPSHIISGSFDDIVDTRISNEDSDYVGSYFLRVMSDFMLQDDLMPDSVFLANSVPKAAINLWSIDDFKTFSTILSSICSDTIISVRRQRHMMTSQLPLHEKKTWFDLEHGVNLEDRERQTGTGTVEIIASRSCYEALMFLLLSSASATVTTLWNDANNKTIVRSEHRVVGSKIHKSVRKLMVKTAARN